MRQFRTTASNEIGKTIKQRRLMLELTQRELADKSGISASHIARVEKGERFPSGKVLPKIAKALEMDEGLLMTIAGYMSRQPSSEEYVYKGLDPYVAKVLSEETVQVQRLMVSMVIILKEAMSESHRGET